MRGNNDMVRNSVNGSGYSRHFADAMLPQWVKSQPKSYAFLFLLLLLVVGATVSTRMLLDPTVLIERDPVEKQALKSTTSRIYPQGTSVLPETPLLAKTKFQLNCTALSHTRTCPRNYPTTFTNENDPERPPSPTCPDYFRWIHEDLRPWARTGITRDSLERAKRTANFRLVIVDGRVYLEKLQDAFQTRDVFTLWGFLQLLRRYPGRLPDLELMFDCVDWPVIKAEEYPGVGVNATVPPPLFRYCGNDETLDIVFPDWSYWGWAEVNIKPWESLLKDLKGGNERIKWNERIPYAYWKGNPEVAETRQDLMKCNASEGKEWNARLYTQDWVKESAEGYKQSDLASQCIHRYKIYIEGSAWSVSEKYILACDSVTLFVKPLYYDFFSRGLLPGHHYWPIQSNDKCRSIKFAVDWGNSHNRKAKIIGNAASKFIQEEVKMDYVYDYMFHLLNEYAKLLQFKPVIPQNAVELCSESMVCPRDGNEKKFMMESLVESPAETQPCTMPHPFCPSSLRSVVQHKQDSLSRVESWEKMYWDNKQNQQA